MCVPRITSYHKTHTHTYLVQIHVTNKKHKKMNQNVKTYLGPPCTAESTASVFLVEIAGSSPDEKPSWSNFYFRRAAHRSPCPGAPPSPRRDTGCTPTPAGTRSTSTAASPAAAAGEEAKAGPAGTGRGRTESWRQIDCLKNRVLICPGVWVALLYKKRKKKYRQSFLPTKGQRKVS